MSATSIAIRVAAATLAVGLASACGQRQPAKAKEGDLAMPSDNAIWRLTTTETNRGDDQVMTEAPRPKEFETRSNNVPDGKP